MVKASTIILAVMLTSAQLFGISCTENKRSDAGGFGSGNQNNEIIQPVQQSSSISPGVDFVMASKAAMPAVVHIKTKYNNESQEYSNPLAQLFGLYHKVNMP